MPSRSQRGFSLIEVLVSVALMGMLMTALIGVSFYLTSTYYQAEGMHRLQRQVVFGMETVYHQLKVARYVVRDTTREYSEDDRVYMVYGLEYDTDGEIEETPPVEIRYEAMEERMFVGGRRFDRIGGLSIEQGAELHECQITVSSVSRFGLVPLDRLPISLTAKVRLRNYVVVRPALVGLPEAVPGLIDSMPTCTITWHTTVDTIGQISYRLWGAEPPAEWFTVYYDEYLDRHEVVIDEELVAGRIYEYRILGCSRDGLSFESVTFEFTTQEAEL